MTSPVRGERFTRFCLFAAVMMPLCYFAAQFAAMPFFPGYNLATDPASLLGTGTSLRPWIFNLGAILTGVCAFLGAIGLYGALRSIANIFVADLVAASLVATGIMSLKAGLFPMPDPRHSSWGFLSALTIAAPLLLLIAVWRTERAPGLRWHEIRRRSRGWLSPTVKISWASNRRTGAPPLSL